jgi:hypothetical protein
VHHAWQKVKDLEANDPSFRGELRDILQKLYE